MCCIVAGVYGRVKRGPGDGHSEGGAILNVLRKLGALSAGPNV